MGPAPGPGRDGIRLPGAEGTSGEGGGARALRDRVAAVGRPDARLLGYTVMANRLHIPLQQRRVGLARVMRPLMSPVA